MKITIGIRTFYQFLLVFIIFLSLSINLFLSLLNIINFYYFFFQILWLYLSNYYLFLYFNNLYFCTFCPLIRLLYKNVPKCAELCINVQKCTEMYKNVQKCAKKYTKMYNSILSDKKLMSYINVYELC